MEPKYHAKRNGLDVVDVKDTPEDVFMDSFLEDGDNGFVEDMEPDDSNIPNEELRIKALQRAIDIAKLLSNVTVEDVIEIAETVVDYISNTEI